VYWHDGALSVGAEADPSGWVLQGDHGFERLYLRRSGSLADQNVGRFKGKYVEVKGTLVEISVRSVAPPQRFFPVLDVEIIRYGQEH
jgi:hypothetical protein